MGCRVVVDHLNIHLGGQWILRDLSFTVEPGEFVAVIGPNGAGKTTLLRSLLGLLTPQSGTVSFVSDQNLPLDVSVLGYAPQSRQIDPETPLRSWDFVSFGLPHRFRPWLTKQDKEVVQAALRATNSERFAHQPIGKLSGGERQRLFLAQALVRNPQILLLDEPTSNLDPGAQENLAAVVKRISQERNIGVLFVTHDVNLVAKYAQRILYMTRTDYEIGRPEEILQPDVMSRLYGAPVEVVQVGSKVIISISSSNSNQEVIADVSV